MPSVLIIGIGSVGSGISQAFHESHTHDWKVTTIDPNVTETDAYVHVPAYISATGQSDQAQIHKHKHNYTHIQTSVEELSDAVFRELLMECDEIVYAAENGNRDAYTNDGTLCDANVVRFRGFMTRVANHDMHIDQMNIKSQLGGYSPKHTHVSYVGGSWTRFEGVKQTQTNRAGVYAVVPMVSDASIPKAKECCNAYETAKSVACVEAEKLSTELKTAVTFWDWISVVPNYAPNYTIARMVTEALNFHRITYSPGCEYGRPLLHSVDAGRALVLYTEHRLSSLTSALASSTPVFTRLILPGVFTPFILFRDIVKTRVEEQQHTRDRDLLLPPIDVVEQRVTPQFLTTRCDGSALLNDIGFFPDPTMIQIGLEETCRSALS